MDDNSGSMDVSTPPRAPEFERDSISALMKFDGSMKEGDTYFLVSADWYKKWMNFSGYRESSETFSGPSSPTTSENEMDVAIEGTSPANIDNSVLLDKNGRLNEGLVEGKDFVYVSSSVWEKLADWYNGASHAIARKVISEGIKSYSVVETYLVRLKVVPLSNKAVPVSTGAIDVELSRKTTILELKSVVRSTGFPNSPVDQLRLFNLFDYDSNSPKKTATLSMDDCLVDESCSLVDAKLVSGQRLGLEIAPSPGQWPISNTIRKLSSSSSSSSDTSSSSSSSSSTSSSSRLSKFLPFGNKSTTTDSPTSPTTQTNKSSSSSSSSPPPPRGIKKMNGLVGLNNLGNTCFMNSGLQCLLNTPPLTWYFLTLDYKDNINKTNPLGMQGKLAMRYGDLVQAVWKGSSSSVSPRDLKWIIGQYAPRFSGYSQQDSHELIAFLLDGLHEDLNLITKKPYIEMKDFARNTPDEVIAEESWRMHKRRNDSIIVDNFQGQYKSTVVCPTCTHTSITFDPFMYLSVPIPGSRRMSRQMVYYRDSSKSGYPVRLRLSLPSSSTNQDLIAQISSIHDTPVKDLVLCNVDKNRVTSILKRKDPAGRPLAEHIYCFRRSVVAAHQSSPSKQVPKSSEPSNDFFRLHFFHRAIRDTENVTSSSSSNTRVSPYSSSNFHPRANASSPFFSHPTILFLPKSFKLEDVYISVMNQFRSMLNTSSSDGSDENENSKKGNECFRRLGEIVREMKREEKDAMKIEGEDSNFNMSVDENSHASDDSEEEGEMDTLESQKRFADDMDIAESQSSMELDNVSGSPKPKKRKMTARQTRLTRQMKKSKRLHSALPFVLRIVDNKNGMFCTKCSRSVDHLGCELLDDDLATFQQKETVNTLCVDWKKGFFDTEESRKEQMKVNAEGSSPSIDDSRPDSVDLYDCLRMFCKKEVLGSKDAWHCPKCRDFKQASKQIDIWRLPEVLVVFLKRFSRGSFSLSKVSTFVDFPLRDLDLSEFVRSTSSSPPLFFFIRFICNIVSLWWTWRGTLHSQCQEHAR